jgi:hypothetical protein
MSTNGKSYWTDQRDIPDSRRGKSTLPGCTCNYRFTCRVCLQHCADRNTADRNAQPSVRENDSGHKDRG